MYASGKEVENCLTQILKFLEKTLEPRGPFRTKNTSALKFSLYWGGQPRIINPKSLGSAFSLCRYAGTDAALVKANFFFASAPLIKKHLKQKIKH